MESARSNERPTAALWVLGLALGLLGIVSRIIPLVQSERVLQTWPTEDGYLMMTIARNLAIGNGFSVSAGEIPTNGTQPLVTLVFAGFFALVGGDRFYGVLLALVALFVVSVLTALMISRLVRRLLADHPAARDLSWLAAGIWLAGPVLTAHTMNALETGPYCLMVVSVAYFFIGPPAVRERPWPWSRTLMAGGLLGLAFLVRNDAVFLILGACLAHLASGLGNKGLLKSRFVETLAFGSLSIVVASPWLLFNLTQFGHLMPVSGRGQSLTGGFATNLPHMPAAISDHILIFLSLPSSLETSAVGILIGLAVIAAAVGFVVYRFRVAGPAERKLLVLGSIYAVSISVFYGLFFGAPWFASRYMAPLSPFFAIIQAVVLGWLALRIAGRVPRLAAVAVVGVSLVGLTAALHTRTHRQRANHQHFQVVRWVDQNVSDEVWVGAIQSGTLGFFHDRTINLDGKVNVHAYEALVQKQEGRYVVDSQIEYLADWMGMKDWLDKPAIEQNFEVIVDEPGQNLAVLRRKPTSQRAADPVGD